MAAFIYTAKRSLKAGHVVDDSYAIDAALASFDVIAKQNKTEKVALDGKTSQTTFNSVVREYQITTDFIDLGSTDVEDDDWKEFLDSVAGGEAFQFDAYGTSGSPVNVENVKMIGSPSYQRVGVEQILQASFRMRVID